MRHSLRLKGQADHVSCLELVDVRWKAAGKENREDWGNLLEIWPIGGIVHLDEPIPVGTTITVTVPGSEIVAKVQSYEQDEFGSYIQFRVDKPWFPTRY